MEAPFSPLLHCLDTAPTSSPLLSLAFAPQSSSAAALVAVGHELQSVDAPIYVYDLRSPAAPILTYDQSHSDDVTFLQFFPATGTASPSTAPILASGSTDGLMTVYDLSKGADEDDAVLSATNTGSSLARGGWLMSSGDTSAAVDGMDAASSLSAQLWAVSDMQTVGVWDAQSVSQRSDSSDAHSRASDHRLPSNTPCRRIHSFLLSLPLSLQHHFHPTHNGPVGRGRLTTSSTPYPHMARTIAA